MTFLEAVKALTEGKCDGIESIATRCVYKKNPIGTICLENQNGSLGPGINLPPSIYLDKWILVNPKPRTEERVYRGWVAVWANGTASIFEREPSKDMDAQHIFPISDTYTYTFPEDE